MACCWLVQCAGALLRRIRSHGNERHTHFLKLARDPQHPHPLHLQNDLMDLRKACSHLLLPVAILWLALLPHGRLAAQSVADFIAIGDSLLALDKPQRALSFYDLAVNADDGATAYVARARAWYVMDRMDRYLLDVEKALKADSTMAEAHYMRALYAMRGEDHIRAEFHAGKALEHGAKEKLRAQSLILRGEARAELRRPSDAIADLEEGLRNGPEDILAMTVLARLLDGAGRHEEALALLERLCELQPKEIGHWVNRGYELNMLGRYSDALPMFGYALGMDKDEPVALSGRAYALLKLDRADEAWTDVERSLRFYPTNPYALRTRALLRLRKGEQVKACEDLSLAKVLGDLPDVAELLQQHCANVTPGRKR